MIPLRLQLRNFMCYGENVPPLILDGIHLACLSGDNGHGKSALLDALTWALWGRTRARSDDDLVQMGKTEMEVELEFAVGKERYRVIRKRALKGKRGIGTLDFQILGDLGYRPIAGDSVHETQRRIGALLHMEYETFINSALLLQGRADEFTIKAPAERKRVLADVLGLAVYDELEERARQRARSAEQTQRELAVALAEIDRELEHRPQYQAERDQLATELATVVADLAEQEAALRRARAEKQELDSKSAKIDDLRQRQQREGARLAAAESNITADRRDLAANEAVIAGREGIETGYHRLLAAREQNELLSGKATQLLDRSARRSVLEQAITRARGALEAEARVHASAVANAKGKADRRLTLERDLADLQRQLALLAGLETQRDSCRAAIQSARGQIDLLKETNERLKENMALLKEKIELLSGEGATCPVCGTELGPAGRASLATQLRAEGKQHADAYRANSSQMKTLEEAAAQAQRSLAGLDQRLAERERLRRQAAAIEAALAEAEAAAHEAASGAQALELVERRLAQADFACAEQEALALLEAEIAALAYDPQAHERLRRGLADLAPFESRWAAMRTAETATELLREKIRQNAELIAHQRQSLADIDALTDSLLREVAAGSRILAALAIAEERVEACTHAGADLRLRLGRAEQLLTHCSFLAEQRREKATAQQHAAEEKGIYEQLALAFGKKGIQAMIIDSAIPEIEEEANILLARITDNRMHVKFETQRDAKVGDGVIETLDIKIADELGYRHYEMYSGGEAFRVNFAIRIALSKLLAMRAGASLQTLIVDEGFGTQDAAGRERLVEAINSISPDFECIIVITHIQELKDAFPVRIDVVKTAEGSQIILTG